MASSRSRVIADHQIRRWAEEPGGKPAWVRGTGGGNDAGIVRLDLPGKGGTRKITLTIPKEVCIEAKGGNRRGRRAA